MTVIVEDSDQLQAEAGRFIGNLEPKKDSAIVIALSGELGAGKMTVGY